MRSLLNDHPTSGTAPHPSAGVIELDFVAQRQIQNRGKAFDFNRLLGRKKRDRRVIRQSAFFPKHS